MASLLHRALRAGEGRSFSRIEELAARVNAIEGGPCPHVVDTGFVVRRLRAA